MNSDVTNTFTFEFVLFLLNALLATLSCVYSEIMFTIFSFFERGGGLENFSKIDKRGGGRLFGTREYKRNNDWMRNFLHHNGGGGGYCLTLRVAQKETRCSAR